ncbi:nucleoside hydrolase [Eubacteriales bacterium OttesenSCG-928-M02]|nr:nucleoside hydrolase [Eubacteriales bacterium OttesenSCG-928-M02]
MKKDCLAFSVPEKKRVRVIISSDCKNEADDPFAICHHLMTPKFDVKGIIAAHFETKAKEFGAGTTMEKSYEEIELVLHHMGLTGAYPVLRGAVLPMVDEDAPVDSEGARFIINEAMKEDDRPLYIACQGTLTDLASALLIEPRIAARMTVIFIGGGVYPKGSVEFNIKQDIHAANMVFSSDVPLWQVPKNAYQQLNTTLTELQVRVAPYGEMGAYLFRQMVELNDRKGDRLDWPHGESWCLGDQATISLLLEDGGSLNYTLMDAPRVDAQCGYLPGTAKRQIRVYHTIDTRLTMEDFFCKLQLFFPREGS